MTKARDGAATATSETIRSAAPRNRGTFQTRTSPSVTTASRPTAATTMRDSRSLHRTESLKSAAASTTSNVTHAQRTHGAGKCQESVRARSTVQGTSKTARSRTTMVGPRSSVRRPKLSKCSRAKASRTSRTVRATP